MSKETEVQTGYYNIVLDPLTPKAFTDLGAGSANQVLWKQLTWITLHRLYNITPNQTSRAVMDTMMHSGKKCVIMPTSKGGGAFTKPVGELSNKTTEKLSGRINAVVAGEDVLDLFGKPETNPFDGEPLRGTGKGTDMVIRFDPQDYLINRLSIPGKSAEEILLHELVHAVCGQRGRMTDIRMPAAQNQDYDDRSEFQAIVVTNIFRSECGLEDLRADHQGFNALPSPLDDDAVFAKRYAGELKQFYHSLPVLSYRLGAIDCPYNPIRQYLLARYSPRQLDEWGAVHDAMYSNSPDPGQANFDSMRGR